MRSRALRRVAAFFLSCSLVGCATTVPYTGVGPYPRLERGAPVPPIDFLGNVLSLPAKLLLWSWKFNLHTISPDTEDRLIAYLDTQDRPAFTDARFRLNQYRPAQDLSRLVRNRHVAWPYRLLLGVPVTLVFDVLLPGRLFPWGDYYNPFTNTVHLYSDHPAIALHEAGHVHDFASRRFKGTYAAIRLVPFVDLYQEHKASKEAISYLKGTADHATELSAYKILYPAYGTYVGSYIVPPIGTVGGALIGHAAGRSEAARRARDYAHEQTLSPAPPEPPTTPTPAAADEALPATSP